jgi:hypothetical protein
MANNYLPRTDAGKMQWLNNFVAKLPNYKEPLGLTEETLKECFQDAENFAYMIGGIEKFRKFTAQITAQKNLLSNGSKNPNAPTALPDAPPAPVLPHPLVANVFGRVGKLVQAIKSSKKYDVPMGKDLGIIGEETAKSFAVMKPALAYAMKAGQPNIKWKKQGMQGINIYADRGDGKGYQFVATDINPDYLDMYPLPPAGQAALWKYKAIYIDRDAEIGQMSDELSVSVSGKL